MTPRRELWQMRVSPRTSCRSHGLVTGSQKRSWAGSSRRVEGLVQGVVRLLELPVAELTADLLLAGQFGDGLAGQGVEGELLACLGRQHACGCGDGGKDDRRGVG